MRKSDVVASLAKKRFRNIMLESILTIDKHLKDKLKFTHPSDHNYQPCWIEFIARNVNTDFG